jgi:hypothetical protein
MVRLSDLVVDVHLDHHVEFAVVRVVRVLLV